MAGAKFVENGQPGRKFFAWVGRGMSSRAAGSLPFHRMYKKTPEGVFLSDVFRCYYRNRFGGKAVEAGRKAAGLKAAGGKDFYAKK